MFLFFQDQFLIRQGDAAPDGRVEKTFIQTQLTFGVAFARHGRAPVAGAAVERIGYGHTGGVAHLAFQSFGIPAVERLGPVGPFPIRRVVARFEVKGGEQPFPGIHLPALQCASHNGFDELFAEDEEDDHRGPGSQGGGCQLFAVV